jgi:hypothetical protein
MTQTRPEKTSFYNDFQLRDTVRFLAFYVTLMPLVPRTCQEPTKILLDTHILALEYFCLRLGYNVEHASLSEINLR